MAFMNANFHGNEHLLSPTTHTYPTPSYYGPKNKIKFEFTRIRMKETNGVNISTKAKKEQNNETERIENYLRNIF